MDANLIQPQIQNTPTPDAPDAASANSTVSDNEDAISATGTVNLQRAPVAPREGTQR